jgi:hypothetical protein
MGSRPLWRWWLWCACNEALTHVHWEWLWDFWSWLILPEWLGWDGMPLTGHGDDPW